MNPETRAVLQLIIRAMLELIEAENLRGSLPHHLSHKSVRQTLLEASKLCDVGGSVPTTEEENDE